MQKPANPPTIIDVARVAGVAVGTVSRVLNDAPNVDADIRRRVLEAAKQLDYDRLRKPKKRAATVVAPRVHTANVAVICFGMEDTLVHLPVVSRAVQGIERAVATEGGSLMLANVPDGARIPSFLTQNKVVGVILKGPNQGTLPDAADVPLLQALEGVPRVWLLGRLPNATGDHCSFDYGITGELVARHFRERGHRRIAFLNPKPGQVQFENVKQGLASAALRHGLHLELIESDRPDQLIWPLPAITSHDKTSQLVSRWNALPAESRPTGLFVPSDRTAIQVYSALERLGHRVGRDVSVISCNNEETLIQGLTPPLTTVDIHADLVGYHAVSQLLWRARNPHLTPHTQVLVEPQLMVRESVQTLPT